MIRHVQKCNAVVVNQKSVELTDESECKSAGRCREKSHVEALGIKGKLVQIETELLLIR
jgi:hypothetical protein